MAQSLAYPMQGQWPYGEVPEKRKELRQTCRSAGDDDIGGTVTAGQSK